jgi:hypothetical protein
VKANDSELADMSASLGMHPDDFKERYVEPGPPSSSGAVHTLKRNATGCILLDERGKCTVYSARPTQCATYPFWPGIVRTAQTFSTEAALCEGIGSDSSIHTVSREDVTRTLVITAIHDDGEPYTYQQSLELLELAVIEDPELLDSTEEEFSVPKSARDPST